MSSSLPPEDVLPVLVADIADDESRAVLEEAADSGGKVLVPLEDAPVSAADHVLEVYVPSSKQPLCFLVQPLGPPTADGFPLRIHRMPASGPARPREEPASAPGGVVRARRASRPGAQLSESHARDLSYTGPMPTEDGQLVGRSLASGKLKIESLIGRGGVGAVYKAVHRELRIPVAVKVLHESFQRDLDFCRRFYAEALAASRLDHPNITRVIDFGQEPEGLLYFAMEYLDGIELRAVLEKERVLPADRVAQVMMQVCAGLSQAHSRGIVHRDIKPENLVLIPGHDDDGQPIEIAKVCDFGVAQHRALDGDEEGTTAGTPEYMSPEQCRGDELDARSDVYACGVVLYELATGQVPFTSRHAHEILKKHRLTPPLPPSKIRPDVDPLLEKITMKALAKAPAERQQSMRELRQELRELLSPILLEDASPPPTAAASPMPPAPPQRRPAPEWLERGPIYGGPASTRLGIRAAATAHDELADAVQMDAQGWMQRLAKTHDTRAFVQLAQRLDGALRTIASRGDPKTLWVVSTALHTIAMEGPQAPGSRAHMAATALRIFEDPAMLATIAELLLAGDEDGREHARRLLVHAGVAGAYGLYGARVKLAGDPTVRAPFLATLKDFGPRAWPVVHAALERIAAMKEVNVGTLELAEDLLLSAPSVGDESAGHVVVKFLRATAPSVCRAATSAIVQLWGERAKPLLVGMLQSKDDVPRVAGIAGLRQLSAIDEHVVPRLHAILRRRVPAGPELRAAAAVALAHAAPSAKQPALSLLAQLLREPAPPAASPGGGLSKEDAVVVAIARSMLQLGGITQRGLVNERAARSPEPLRGQLRRLLA